MPEIIAYSHDQLLLTLVDCEDQPVSKNIAKEKKIPGKHKNDYIMMFSL